MAEKKSDILSSDGLHLKMMSDRSGITVDKELPKYTNIREEVETFKNRKAPSTQVLNNLSLSEDALASDVRNSIREKEELKEAMKQYEKIRVGSVREVNIYINKHMFDDIFSSFNAKYSTPNEIVFEDTSNPISIMDGVPSKKKQKRWKPIVQKLSDLLKVKSKELEETYSFNVLEFFAQVKGLTKQSKDAYVDRLIGYIIALKNCDVSGQTALKEKLVRDMVVNKYESVLYANDMYYVVTEDQVVDFVKKTEKGVRLTYVKNYMRVIPPEVVAKINEVNKLEIFDNYAVLHYDPECKAYAETIEETKKRMDPILFGLIRGSHKLYYITDWIDEFCNLTLDKFVETLQIQKDSLKMEEKIPIGN